MTTADRDEKPDFHAMVSRWFATGNDDESAQLAQEAFEAEQREARLTESGISGVITDEDAAMLVSGKGIIETPSLRIVERWVTGRARAARSVNVLVLLGPTSQGKTVSEAWLISRLGGRFITAEELRRCFVSTHWRDGERLGALLSSRCVVVDDAGVELEANGAAAAMFELVNRRSGSSRMWTMITSNLTPAGFRERYGERTVRRIEHSGYLTVVTGPDLRRKP